MFKRHITAIKQQTKLKWWLWLAYSLRIDATEKKGKRRKKTIYIKEEDDMIYRDDDKSEQMNEKSFLRFIHLGLELIKDEISSKDIIISNNIIIN